MKKKTEKPLMAIDEYLISGYSKRRREYTLGERNAFFHGTIKCPLWDVRIVTDSVGWLPGHGGLPRCQTVGSTSTSGEHFVFTVLLSAISGKDGKKRLPERWRLAKIVSSFGEANH